MSNVINSYCKRKTREPIICVKDKNVVFLTRDFERRKVKNIKVYSAKRIIIRYV